MKFSLRLAALCLAVLLTLCSCTGRGAETSSAAEGAPASSAPSSPPSALPEGFERADLSFEEMPYVHMDFDETAARYENFARRVREAGSAEEVIGIWLEEAELTREYSDMQTLAMIRFNLDTSDAFWTEEYQYMQDFMTRLQSYGNSFTQALIESPYLAELEERFGARTIQALKILLENYTPEQEALEIEENELITRYVQWNSQDKVISYGGNQYTVTDLYYVLMGGAEQDKPVAASLVDEYYREQNAEYGELYRRLTALRTEKARLLGYEDYLDYYYAVNAQRGYSREEIEAFRGWVKEYLVPVREALRQSAMERLGAGRLTLFQNYDLLPEGENFFYNLSIQNTDDIIEASLRLMRELSPETRELVDYLEQYQLMDLKAANHKSDGAFTTFFYGYREPFVFSSYEDAGTYIHELGHALNFYRTAPTEVMEQNLQGADIMEIHSQSLELLAAPKLSILYGETAPYVERSNVFDMMQDIISACIIDEFQHEIYENPEMTLEEYNAVYARLQREYLGEVDNLGITAFDEGMDWIDVSHLFEVPLYYIEYSLSGTVALNFWELSREDWDNAFAVYLEFIASPLDQNLGESLEAAGLRSIFEEENIRGLGEDLRQFLAA
ncbi:MAG: M3 family metallopeptidase [Oscillospiraceae bacterium]|nr:M3 family metallopeptidase [Oscillospiraceae bacterium]